MLGTRDKKLSNNSIKNDLIIIKMRKLCEHCYLAEIMPVCSNYAKNYASIIYKCLPFPTNPFQKKTELFCSVFKKICVYTYCFRIVFARPHYNNYQERLPHGTVCSPFWIYARSSGLAPGRVYLDDVTVFR